jgi:poly(A) polymerase
VLARAEHRLSRAGISVNALKVLYRLHRSGFLAYLVGGAVRDLLLGRTPKDFDIGTNARPQQIRQLFRNARVIGRRFRLVHIRFADEIVEVATFRRSPEPPEMDDGETADALAPTVEAGEFGTPEEDAWRRDFTVNGLFYDIGSFAVIDYVDGLSDLHGGVIRSIGDARRRFGEDPVRMMRAVEYAARLEFALAPETDEAIVELHAEIRRAAPARIAYELMESLRSAHALAIFRGLARRALLDHILPEVGGVAGPSSGLVWRLLAAADGWPSGAERLTEEALLGALLLPAVLAATNGREGERPVAELERAIRTVLEPAALRLALSNFRGHLLRGAFLVLLRLLVPPRSPKLVLRTFRHEAFPTAWQLASLLVLADPAFETHVEPWRRALARVRAGLAPEVEVRPLSASAARRRGRRRRGRRRAAQPAEVTA